MSFDTRVALIRRITVVMAATGIGIFAAALLFPGSFGVSTTTAMVLGVPATALNVIVAVLVHRWAESGRIQRLAFAQVLFLGVAAGSAEGLADDPPVAILMAMALIFVYSSMVLSLRQHSVAAGTAMATAIVGSAIGHHLTTRYTAALLLVSVIAVLSAAAAQLHEVQMQDREAALEQARRARRALEAAVSGIQAATTTNSQQIMEAVTMAAGRLVGGPAGVFVLGTDGRLHAGAHHGLAPISGRAFHPDEGLFGQVIRSGATCVIAPDDDTPSGVQRALGLRAAIGTPIRVRGEIIGTLLGGRAAPDALGPEEADAWTLLADHAGRALEMSQEAAADKRTATRLVELDRIKDDIVATVSHELRTPVTIISGLAETLAIHPNLTAEARAELTSRLWANGVSLAQIVEQLLDAALLQRGTLKAARRDVPLAALVERTVTRLQPLLASHSVRSDVPASMVVDADPTLLERVIENLLVNAVRHTPAGTAVTVEATRTRGDVDVTVADDGPGIRAEDLPRVLERFGRGGQARDRARGMGIGLALAHEILRAHGSALRVRSPEGEGARFEFTLPSWSADPPPRPHGSGRRR